jgi:hypothetical protein
MNRPEHDIEQLLDRALDAIRDETPQADAAERSTARVWTRVSQELEDRAAHVATAHSIRGCADFQRLIPEYLEGRLAGGARLLLADHMGECVPCRRALKERQVRGRTAAVAPARTGSSESSWLSRTAWRLVAAAIVVLALVGVSYRGKALSFKSGGLIHIEAAEGEVLRIGKNGTTPLAPGDDVQLASGESVRTGRESSAVLTLADRSRVEMRQRSQLAVGQQRYLMPGTRADGVLGLERGGIIVEASKQGSGHLFVDTEDCRVAVTGTVFSVSHGTKGSRVSVVEGEVHVNHSGAESILHPGDQTATSTSIRPVPVEQDIAWSRNSPQYLELLREVRALSHEVDALIRPGLRYETQLLDLAPASTVVWVGVPNVSSQLADAFHVIEQRVASNELLREWWVRQVESSGELAHALEKIRTYGQYLGPEVVVSLGLGAGHDLSPPLLIAHLSNATAFRAALEADIATVTDTHPERPLRLLERIPPAGAAESAGSYDSLKFWIDGDLVGASPSEDRLRELDAALHGGPQLARDSDGFHARLSNAYRDGVEWIVGVDLEHIVPHDPGSEPLEKLGLLDMQHLIAEREQRDDARTDNRVILTFNQPRRHLAAWLADPAPMGALDYIGPDANFVAAVVIKQPKELVDDLFQFVGKSDEGFESELERFEKENRIDVRRDFAAPLGGEIAVALDGPMLPSPAWKLVLEVYDPARLQHTIEWIVEQVQTQAIARGRAGFRLDRETVGDREFFTLTSLDTGLAASYVYDRGYLIAAPSRGLLDRALQARSSGISFPNSPAFTHLLPQDGQVNFSGMLYHNLGSVLGPFSKWVHGNVDSMTAQDRQLLEGLSAESRPGMALLYGADRQITLTGTDEGGLLGSGLTSFSSFGSLLGMQESLVHTLAHEAEESTN